MPPRRRSCKRDSCLDLLNSKIFIVHALAGNFETDLCTFPMQGMIFFQAEDTNARFRNQHLKKFLFPSHYPPLRRDRGETWEPKEQWAAFKHWISLTNRSRNYLIHIYILYTWFISFHINDPPFVFPAPSFSLQKSPVKACPAPKRAANISKALGTTPGYLSCAGAERFLREHLHGIER